MTDPQNPSAVPPNAPENPPAYSAAPPPAYSSAPPPAYNAQPAPGAPAKVPGKTMGIVAFVLSLLFFLQPAPLVGLILGIVALVQSRKAGVKNGWALAAIIIGAVSIVIGIILAVVLIALFAGGLAAACAELGPGVHTLEGGGTITCS